MPLYYYYYYWPY